MNEIKNIPIFLFKSNKSKIHQKLRSMSKLNNAYNNNNNIINLNFDYFDVLNQIKSKKQEFIGNSTLYQKYLNNNKNSNKYNNRHFKYKLREPLITETVYNRNTSSFKNTFTEGHATYSLSTNKLLLKQKSISHIRPIKLINRIEHFEDRKTVPKTYKLFFKRNQPMELSHSYKNYVEKANKLSFSNYSNANTKYAHNIRSQYLLNKFHDCFQKEKEKNEKYSLNEKEKKEIESELRDEVFYPSLDLMKISKQIKNILANEYKFNQIQKHEHFYDNYVNRINFIFDNFKIPYIKNNLIKIKFEEINYHNNSFDWKWINSLGKNAMNYVARAKIKLQREKDEKMKFLREKNKIKNKYIYYKKLSTNQIYNSKKEIEKIIYKKYYTENDDVLPEKEKYTLDEILEKKNYFENKIEKCTRVYIAEPKLRKLILTNINENIFNN